MQHVRALEISEVSLRKAALINRACAPTVASPISPSSSALVTRPATESTTLPSIDHSPAWKSSHSKCAIDQYVARRNDIDIGNFFVAETHDCALAIIFGDLLNREIEILVSRGGHFVFAGFFFSFCSHIVRGDL